MASERRKDVMVYHYNPKAKFFLVTLRMQNVPGALGNLGNILGIRGINILEGYFGALSSATHGTVSFFIESKNPRMDKAWLKDFLESSVLVSEVEIKESVDGFLADSQNFPLTWNNGDRAVVLRVESARAMLNAIKSVAGDKGDEIVYQAGLQHGKLAWSSLFAEFHPDSKEGLSEMLDIFAAVGWGKLELHELDPVRKTAKIRMTNGFECAGVASGKPLSNFIRGHLAGALSAYFETDLKGVETKCVSKGDKYCEFELSE